MTTELDELPEKVEDCAEHRTEFTVVCHEGITWGGLLNLVEEACCGKYVPGKVKRVFMICCFADAVPLQSDAEDAYLSETGSGDASDTESDGKEELAEDETS